MALRGEPDRERHFGDRQRLLRKKALALSDPFSEDELVRSRSEAAPECHGEVLRTQPAEARELAEAEVSVEVG